MPKNEAMPKIDVRHLFNPTVLVSMGLMAVIVMMILPMPAIVLDIGLALSFALAILIFTITLFIDRPLDFSSFPVMLLASLMLRLSLNVSSTKLIIGEGHNGTNAAGSVIEGFANFVMGNSLFLGLVTFGVLLIVNFVVITRGAGRMAEVSARFALDGMPGRQLAIDADVAAGAINHKEAQARRQIEQEETTFFGSLDGASKFIKGDAIAGLLITAMNLIMGICMGIIVHGMPFDSALETYAILTVGDGLVSQIPGVITSVGAGLLLAKGGVAGSVDRHMLGQISRYPAALATVAGLLALFALLPGMPFGPFILGAAVLGLIAWRADRHVRRTEAEKQAEERKAAGPERERKRHVQDIDDLSVTFGSAVSTEVVGTDGLASRIEPIRDHFMETLGFLLPDVRLREDPTLPARSYAVAVHGSPVAQGEVIPGRVLLILGDDRRAPFAGTDATEPVFGAPARWISADDRIEAMATGFSVASGAEVVATHLIEVVRAHLPDLLTRTVTRALLDRFAEVGDPDRAGARRRLIDEIVPEMVTIAQLQSVLRQLLDERVSIRNLGAVLEGCADAQGQGVDAMTEQVRRRLSLQITSNLKSDDGSVPLLQLGEGWEKVFREHEHAESGVALPPSEIGRLADGVRLRLSELNGTGVQPALVTSGHRRRLVHTLLKAKGLATPVLSYDEVDLRARPLLLGTVE
jgi:flagellar biosynthesis protein FlhA